MVIKEQSGYLLKVSLQCDSNIYIYIALIMIVINKLQFYKLYYFDIMHILHIIRLTTYVCVYIYIYILYCYNYFRPYLLYFILNIP